MKRLLTILAVPLVLLACGGGEERMIIQNTGSDTLLSVAQGWAEAYAVVDPSVAVAVSGGGSGTGISSMINSTVILRMPVARCVKANTRLHALRDLTRKSS